MVEHWADWTAGKSVEQRVGMRVVRLVVVTAERSAVH